MQDERLRRREEREAAREQKSAASKPAAEPAPTANRVPLPDGLQQLPRPVQVVAWSAGISVLPTGHEVLPIGHEGRVSRILTSPNPGFATPSSSRNCGASPLYGGNSIQPYNAQDYQITVDSCLRWATVILDTSRVSSSATGRSKTKTSIPVDIPLRTPQPVLPIVSRVES